MKPSTRTTMPSSSTLIRAKGQVALSHDVRKPPVKFVLVIDVDNNADFARDSCVGVAESLGKWTKDASLGWCI